MAISNQIYGLSKYSLVNAALAEELKTIHAFSQKALTPDQWAALADDAKPAAESN